MGTTSLFGSKQTDQGAALCPLLAIQTRAAGFKDEISFPFLCFVFCLAVGHSPCFSQYHRKCWDLFVGINTKTNRQEGTAEDT